MTVSSLVRPSARWSKAALLAGVTFATFTAIFAIRSFGQSSNPGIAMVDNRYIVVNLTTADPDQTNRAFVGKDFQLNTIIHYNTRLALSTGGDPGSPGNASSAPPASAGAVPTAAGQKPLKTVSGTIQDGNSHGL